MIPPWIIEELEEERRRQERERDSLRLPLGEEAREREENPGESTTRDLPRGVRILDISPDHPNMVPM